MAFWLLPDTMAIVAGKPTPTENTLLSSAVTAGVPGEDARSR